MAVKKADRLLLLGLLAAGLLLGLLVWLNAKPGARVEVRIDGVAIASYPLSEDGSYRLESMGGSNLLVIEGGKARVTEADCPDGLCMGMGSIQRSGQSIVCLPHHLVVTILSGRDRQSAVDVTAK